MTVEEFLAWEETQPEKHELLHGEVYPHEVYGMVGARRIHVMVAGNCFAALKAHLRGGPCQAFINDMKLAVSADSSFYPDILVTCDPADLGADLVMHSPKVIIEVLSPSTANYDRGEKFFAYRRLPSLVEYALIDPESRQVEVYRRVGEGDWLLVTSDSPKGLILNSLDFHAPPETVFEGM
ncbi:MAG: Uma2 family endonuclease [Rhodocyclaceae bacterium]|nr:Uma2 family endonuclease [Rhodocyclaceae bacterium]